MCVIYTSVELITEFDLKLLGCPSLTFHLIVFSLLKYGKSSYFIWERNQVNRNCIRMYKVVQI